MDNTITNYNNMIWLRVLKAGEYETNNYTECIADDENYLDSLTMVWSFNSNGDEYDTDDTVQTNEIDNEVKYFCFLLDLLDPTVQIQRVINCKIYVFEREDQMRKKIRVQLVE